MSMAHAILSCTRVATEPEEEALAPSQDQD